MVVGALSMHLASLGLGEPQAVEWTSTVVLSLLYLVPIAGCFGYLLSFTYSTNWARSNSRW